MSGVDRRRTFSLSLTAKRKAAYIAKHPETAYEARPGRAGKYRQDGDNSAGAERFTKETADRTGQSERSVQRNSERGEKVTPAALAMVKGTSLDTGAAAGAVDSGAGDKRRAGR